MDPSPAQAAASERDRSPPPPPPPPPSSSASPLAVVCSFWKDFDLEKERSGLDEQGLKIAENQETSQKNRRRLAENTRDFKKASSADKLSLFNSLLKSYQEEVDNITKRAKFGENAFLNIYQKLYEASDPYPALASMADQDQKLSELETENRKMKLELEEYRAEAAHLKNQQATIRRLEERNRQLEQQMEEKVREMVEMKHRSMAEDTQKTLEVLKDRERSLQDQLRQATESVKNMQKLHESAQRQLFELRTQSEEDRTAKEAEVSLLMDEVERAQSRLVSLEREKGDLRSQLQTTHEDTSNNSDYMDPNDILESSLSAKEKIISELNAELRSIESTLSTEKEMHVNELKKLTGLLSEKETAITELKKELQERPTARLVDDLKKKVQILQAVGYNSIEAEDWELATNGEEMSKLEALLLDKNRKMEHELTQLKVKISEKSSLLEEAENKIAELTSKVEEQQKLILKLEDDILKGCSSTDRRSSLLNDWDLQEIGSNEVSEQIEEWTEGRGSPKVIKVLLEKESSSILKKDDIRRICKIWKISEDRVSTSWTAGSVRIYEDLVNEEKFKFPLHSFYVEILNYFKIPPGRIMKNGWLTIIKFVENCEKKKDVPSVEKYLKMYSLIAYKKLFCTMRKHRAIIEENNSQEIEMTGRHGKTDWRCRYFYLKPKPNSLWEFPVEWGEEKPQKRVNQNVNSEPIRKGINSIESERTRILEVELASANKMCSSQTKRIKTLEIQLLSANEKLKEICSIQNETIKMLEIQFSSANENLKEMCLNQNERIKALEIQILSANENMKDQENKLKCLQLRLMEVEQQNRDGERLRKKLHNTMLELKGNIRVLCRVRPLLLNEKEKNEEVAVSYAKSEENSLELIHNAQSYTFVFDKVFNHFTTQEEVFDEVSELVQSAIDGYKVCIFAYGQSGSGKTHTMMGNPEVHDKKGVIPRALEQIFQASQCPVSQGWIYNVQVSMLEIYNEIINDLIPKHSTSVGPSVVDVRSISEVYSLLDQVDEKRSVAKTEMNERSSRSHLVFTVRIVGENEETHQRVQGVLNLIDLAGSERLDKSGALGDTLKETKAINKSLFYLTEVIAAISKKDAHISFRNSTLTKYLEPCLGGGSKTLMLVNLSPVVSSSGESICSLRFAQKVMKCETGPARRQQTYGEAPARQQEKTPARLKTPARQAKEMIVHSLKPIARSMKRQPIGHSKCPETTHAQKSRMKGKAPKARPANKQTATPAPTPPPARTTDLTGVLFAYPSARERIFRQRQEEFERRQAKAAAENAGDDGKSGKTHGVRVQQGGGMYAAKQQLVAAEKVAVVAPAAKKEPTVAPVVLQTPPPNIDDIAQFPCLK